MVNRKILGIAVVLMAVAMMAVPVMAKPATKIEGVTLTTVVKLVPDPDATRSSTHNNIVHNEGTSTGTATLTIPGQDLLHFDYYGIWNGRSHWTGFNAPDAEGSNVINGMVVLTCTDEGIDGTFEGTYHTKNVGLPPVEGILSYTEYHMVLHGTGDFQGQTLKVSYAGAPPADLAGCLIIPK
jgi:hypothetical protein